MTYESERLEHAYRMLKAAQQELAEMDRVFHEVFTVSTTTVRFRIPRRKGP